MGDFRVENAQKFLNERYSGKPGFKKLVITGKPGTITCKGLVGGLQLELGIQEATGFFGPNTKKYFEQKVGELKPNDEGIFATLLQHALFCKGYNAGNVTGNFSNQTAQCILKLKKDTGVEENSPNVDSIWMKAIFNPDAYRIVNKGDQKIYESQKYINKNYYKISGVNPCDGHYSRDTSIALIYALQQEEGILEPTGTFGLLTKQKCPNLPYDNRYNSDKLKRFIKLIQFSLYYNGYKNINFNGEYDNLTQNAIVEFQDFMSLDCTKNCNVDTIMSLMISKGNTDRKSLGCDCSIKLDENKANMLYNDGYKIVGRYLTNVKGGRDKKMDINEFRTILKSGLRVFLIFQEGNENPSHFVEGNGKIDCLKAVKAAEEIKAPYNSVIYFTVDCDFMDYEVTEKVIPYFEEVKQTMNELNSKYRIGIYGSRNICIRTWEKKLTEFSFVSDMSTGYSGNLGYPMPKNWSFDQFSEYKFKNQFSLDKNAYSGRDPGISYINSGEENYDRISAINYAKKWAFSFNSEFFDCSNSGGDCANFVSQCLHAGGLPMSEDWKSGRIFINAFKNQLTTPSFVNARKQYNYFSNKYRNGDIIEIKDKSDIVNKINNA